MSFESRCPHAPLSAAVFKEAERALGRRSFLFGLAAASIAMLVPRVARATGVTVLKAARLFDGRSIRTPGLLVVGGDRIVSMHEGDAGSGANIVDLGDATICRDLIDCHTHIADFVVPSRYIVMMFPQYRTADNVPEATIYSVRNAQLMLRNGFTTIRDVGGGAGIDLAIRNAINNGAIVGPRVLAAGQALSITGGHGDSNDVPGWVDEDPSVKGGAISYGPYGFRELVRENVKLHVDVIKILATGGVLSYGDVWDIPQFNLDEVQAVVDESTKFQRRSRPTRMAIPASRLPLKAACIRSSMGPASAKRRCRTCNSAARVSCRRFGRSTRSYSRAIPTTFPRDRCRRPSMPRSCATKGCTARSRRA